MSFDHNLTKKIGLWLKNDDSSEKHILDGADLLLRLTTNRTLFAAIRLNPARYAETVRYQLQKHYDFRVADLTLQELRSMRAEADAGSKAIGVSEKVESASEEAAAFSGYGRRPDHDSLPENIRNLYVRNLEIRRKMQQLHLIIRTKYKEITNCSASDVYSFVRELLNYEKEYTRNWSIYDAASPEL